LQVLFVLGGVLDFGFDACAVMDAAVSTGVILKLVDVFSCFLRLGCGRTFKDPHGGGEIVDSASGSQRSGDDGGRGHEIVRECVVQITLWVGKKGDGQSQYTSSRVRCAGKKSAPARRPSPEMSYLQLENILHRVEFVLISGLASAHSFSGVNWHG
jgi:hypothetical protein